MCSSKHTKKSRLLEGTLADFCPGIQREVNVGSRESNCQYFKNLLKGVLLGDNKTKEQQPKWTNICSEAIILVQLQQKLHLLPHLFSLQIITTSTASSSEGTGLHSKLKQHQWIRCGHHYKHQMTWAYIIALFRHWHYTSASWWLYNVRKSDYSLTELCYVMVPGYFFDQLGFGS